MLAFMTSEGLLILLGLKTGGEIDQLPSKPLEAKLFTEGEIDTGKRIRLCVGAIPQRDLEGHPTASDNIYFDYTPPGAGWLELERIEAIITPQAYDDLNRQGSVFGGDARWLHSIRLEDGAENYS